MSYELKIQKVTNGYILTGALSEEQENIEWVIEDTDASESNILNKLLISVTEYFGYNTGVGDKNSVNMDNGSIHNN